MTNKCLIPHSGSLGAHSVCVTGTCCSAFPACSAPRACIALVYCSSPFGQCRCSSARSQLMAIHFSGGCWMQRDLLPHQRLSCLWHYKAQHKYCCNLPATSTLSVLKEGHSYLWKCYLLPKYHVSVSRKAAGAVEDSRCCQFPSVPQEGNVALCKAGAAFPGLSRRWALLEEMGRVFPDVQKHWRAPYAQKYRNTPSTTVREREWVSCILCYVSSGVSRWAVLSSVPVSVHQNLSCSKITCAMPPFFLGNVLLSCTMALKFN